jgi:hypothetical protein
LAELELCIDLSALIARPNQFRSRTGTPEQCQRIYDDGFAGPRLSGQHIQAGPQVQGDIIEQGQAADAEERQHGPVITCSRVAREAL